MYRVSVTKALRLTGATSNASGLYQRLSRLRALEATEKELAVAEYDGKIGNSAAAALVCLGGEATTTPHTRTPTVETALENFLSEKNVLKLFFCQCNVAGMVCYI